jgi:hypothetical protein
MQHGCSRGDPWAASQTFGICACPSPKFESVRFCGWGVAKSLSHPPLSRAGEVGSSMVWTYGRVPCKLLSFEVAGSQVCIEVPQGTGFEILIKVLSSFSSDSKAFGQVGALDSYYQRRVERKLGKTRKQRFRRKTRPP